MTADPGTTSLTQEGGQWLLTLEGEHDVATVPMLEHEMQHVAASGTTVVIDLSGATFIDCSVVGWLLRWSEAARESAHLHLAIAIGQDDAPARRLLALLQLDDLVHCEATREDARTTLIGRS